MTTTVAKREPRVVRTQEPLQALHDDFEALWTRLVGGWGPAWLAKAAPAVDLTETGATLELQMDLPGYKPEEINVQVSNNVLTVSGKHEEATKQDAIARHRTERRCGSFSRTLTLPTAVNEDEVEAQFRDGVLTVTLPKCDQCKCRKVEVQH